MRIAPSAVNHRSVAASLLHCVHQSPHPKPHLDRLSRFCTAHGRETLCFRMGHLFSPQNCPFARVSEPPSNTCIPVFTEPSIANGSSIGSSVSAGLTNDIKGVCVMLSINVLLLQQLLLYTTNDRPTDRPAPIHRNINHRYILQGLCSYPSVYSNRPHLRSTAMRLNNTFATCIG